MQQHYLQVKLMKEEMYMPKCDAQLDHERYDSILKKHPTKITDDDLKFVCRLAEGKTDAAASKYLIKAVELVGKRYLEKYKEPTTKHSNQDEATYLANIENQKGVMNSKMIKEMDPKEKYDAIRIHLLMTQGKLLEKGASMGSLYSDILGISDPVSKNGHSSSDKPNTEKLKQLIDSRDKVFQDTYNNLGEGFIRKAVPDPLKGFGFMKKLMQETDVTSNHLKKLRETLSQINDENNETVVNHARHKVREILASIDANAIRPIEMSKLYLELCQAFVPTPKEINEEKDNEQRTFLGQIKSKLDGTISVLSKEINNKEINNYDNTLQMTS